VEPGLQTVLGDGAKYDPVTDEWTPMSARGSPGARYLMAAVWTGREFIAWGGMCAPGGGEARPCGGGGAYSPETDTWRRLSSAGAPSDALIGQPVWTGSQVIFWGSQTTNLAFLYDPDSDSWSRSPPPPAGFVARTGHSAVWTGTEMIVWGGAMDAHPRRVPLGDGAVFTP